MTKKRRALRFASLALGALAFFGAPAWADPAADSESPFIVDSWSAEQDIGLPDNVIVSLIQARDGYLWLGTLHGLVRFDGVRFTVFNENNTPGLESDRIVFLFEDQQSNLWVGTDPAGLLLMKNGIIQDFDDPQVRSVGTVTYAEEDAASNIWFSAVGEGLLFYSKGQMNAYPDRFSSLLQPRAARMEISTPSGSVWRLYSGRVQEWRGDQLLRDLGPGPWDNATVRAVCVDHSGNLIVGTQGAGIFWLDARGRWRQISTEQGLSKAFVLSLCLDRDGNLWAGTDGGGLDRIKMKRFNTLAGLPAKDAQSLSADATGGFWTAYNAAGLSHWSQEGAVENYAIGQASNAWTVLVDREQGVWAGTFHGEGLFQLQDNQFQPVPRSGNLGQDILALFEDRAGQIWAGTRSGLGHWDGQNWKLFTTRDGLSDNNVRAIAQDSDGTLWVGTESGGLDSFKDGKFISLRAAPDGLPGDDISCLYADRDGVLWVGTGGHGLGRLQNGKWARYATANGLASDSICYMLEDDETNLWIGSNAGLMRIPKKSLNDFAAGGTNVIACRIYGKADGLPSRECSFGSQPSGCRTGDGRLWFPTINGVASVNPKQLAPVLQAPVVMIESVLVDGREQKTNRLESAWPSSVVIPPGGEELEIHYTALDFSAPEQVRFTCWLEGHQAKPTDVGNERIARYPKLPPGHYRFHVNACNEDGVWNVAGSVLDITVQPQFWETAGFRAGAAIVLLGLLAAIVRYVSTQKLHRQLQAHLQREALERERARIARDLHDQLGANLTQVALLGEMAEADKGDPAEVESHAQQISQTARETTRSLDEIVWAVNPANDTLEGLANYAGKYAQEYFALAGLRCRADLPARLPAVPIPPEVRHNVFLALKEAVNNVVKHAQATEARIRLRLEPGRFIWEIEDNGRGLGDGPAPENRNGLRNMKRRMEDIHGEFWIGRAAEKGTMVRLIVPMN